MKLFLFTLLSFPLLSYGQTFSDGNDFVVNGNRSVQTNPGDNSSLGLTDGTSSSAKSKLDDNGETLGDTGAFNVTQTGGLDNTNMGQNLGGGVQMMGLAMAGMFAKQCGPHNTFACVAAGLSAADAMMGSSAKSAAFQTGTYMDPTAGGYDSNNTDNGADPVVQSQLQDVLHDLANQGYTLNEDGSVTGPNGQSYSSSDLASMQALQNAGATAQGAANFMKNMKNVKAAAAKKAGVNLNAVKRNVASASGASSGGAVKAITPGDLVIEEIEYRGVASKKNKMSAKAAAKLSKNFNGEPIGIGMANLFLIVHEKYKEKNQKRNFLTKEY